MEGIQWGLRFYLCREVAAPRFPPSFPPNLGYTLVPVCRVDNNPIAKNLLTCSSYWVARRLEKDCWGDLRADVVRVGKGCVVNATIFTGELGWGGRIAGRKADMNRVPPFRAIKLLSPGKIAVLSNSM